MSSLHRRLYENLTVSIPKAATLMRLSPLPTLSSQPPLGPWSCGLDLCCPGLEPQACLVPAVLELVQSHGAVGLYLLFLLFSCLLQQKRDNSRGILVRNVRGKSQQWGKTSRICPIACMCEREKHFKVETGKRSSQSFSLVLFPFCKGRDVHDCSSFMTPKLQPFDLSFILIRQALPL